MSKVMSKVGNKTGRKVESFRIGKYVFPLMTRDAIARMVTPATKSAVDEFVKKYPLVLFRSITLDIGETHFALFGWDYKGNWTVMQVRSKGTFRNRRELYTYESLENVNHLFRPKKHKYLNQMERTWWKVD